MILPFLTGKYFSFREIDIKTNEEGYFLPLLSFYCYDEDSSKVALLTALANSPLEQSKVQDARSYFENLELPFYTDEFNLSTLEKFSTEKENRKYNSLGVMLDVFNKLQSNYMMSATLIDREVLPFLMGRPSVMNSVSKLVNVKDHKDFIKKLGKLNESQEEDLEIFGSMAVDNKEELSSFLSIVKDNIIENQEHFEEWEELFFDKNIVSIEEENLVVSSKPVKRESYCINREVLKELYSNIESTKVKETFESLVSNISFTSIIKGYTKSTETEIEQNGNFLQVLNWYLRIFETFEEKGYENLTFKDFEKEFNPTMATISVLKALGFFSKKIKADQLKKDKEDVYGKMYKQKDFSIKKVDSFPKETNITNKNFKSIFKMNKDYGKTEVNFYISGTYLNVPINIESPRNRRKNLYVNLDSVLSYLSYVEGLEGVKTSEVNYLTANVIYDEMVKLVEQSDGYSYVPAEYAKSIIETLDLKRDTDKHLAESMATNLYRSISQSL